jgi:hypothetical protein
VLLIFIKDNDEEVVSANITMDIGSVAPKATNIYISTKTKIAYLNTVIDLKNIFWKLPIIPYSTASNGVIKKQMKFNSTTQEELNFIQEKSQKETYFEEHIITHIDNPSGRIKFKDIRKLSIGISKKDIVSYRVKQKGAFYKCFVLILRVHIGVFKEFHVKIFNTGKIEIPGVQNMEHIPVIIESLLHVLRPLYSTILYNKSCEETVLINSNFNCGFYHNYKKMQKTKEIIKLIFAFDLIRIIKHIKFYK